MNRLIGATRAAPSDAMPKQPLLSLPCSVSLLLSIPVAVGVRAQGWEV